jgi:branched-chain amino acid transport system ATP-binding protein
VEQDKTLGETAMSDELLLHAQGLNKQFGAVVAAQDVNMRVQDRRAGEPDWQQRCGQDHLCEHDHRLRSCGQRQHIGLGGTDISRMTPREITRMGVARSFQIPQLYPA